MTEDVLQTVYLNVLEGKAQFDGRSALKTWLFAVIRKTAAAEQRRRITWGFRFRFFKETEDPESDESVEVSIYASEARAVFRRALARLPRRQQEVLHLVFYQDLTLEETAEALGISVGSVRTHYDRGKKRLRNELERMEEFSESRIVRPAS
jgi:RNA polymerase sigma-70 factor (ECF subfamily)